ncbi:hypothetical protein CCACVL1_15310 [Corchorus capsularis]|uniref:Uncharacterized protein n=1 Tax=Corchorus capsularis TaxID=210143 RepID=A0A1R3I2W9_COCAP|nr:hypothetical protein CCACVL1_15310 [Corchorus capsularis]
MGAKGSKHSNSKREAAKALITHNINVRSSSHRSSIIEAIKPECLKKKKLKKNKQLPEKRITKARMLTLEDWLLASPGPAGLQQDSFNGGELHVFKQISRKVHPSSVNEAARPLFTPAESFSMDFSSGDVSGSSFSRSQSGKLRKKVSFRLPEESDIVIFYSPLQTFGNISD